MRWKSREVQAQQQKSINKRAWCKRVVVVYMLHIIIAIKNYDKNGDVKAL